MPALEPLYSPLTSPKQAKKAGWKKVGELEDGRPIWEAEFTEKVGQEPLIINGQPQFVMDANHQIVKQKMRPVFETKRRRFVEEQGSNGCNHRNFHFEPDPDEKARVERKRKIAEVQANLAEALVDNGLSVDALIGALKEDEKPRKRQKAEA